MTDSLLLRPVNQEELMLVRELIDYISTFKGKSYSEAFDSTFIDDHRHSKEYYETIYVDDYADQEAMRDPIAYLATTDTNHKDIFHYGEAMKQSDGDDFKKAIKVEFLDRIK